MRNKLYLLLAFFVLILTGCATDTSISESIPIPSNIGISTSDESKTTSSTENPSTTESSTTLPSSIAESSKINESSNVASSIVTPSSAASSTVLPSSDVESSTTPSSSIAESSAQASSTVIPSSITSSSSNIYESTVIVESSQYVSDTIRIIVYDNADEKIFDSSYSKNITEDEIREIINNIGTDLENDLVYSYQINKIELISSNEDEIIYKIDYTKSFKEYNIVFYDYFGNEISNTNYHYNDVIEYPSDLEPAYVGSLVYTFTEWNYKETNAVISTNVTPIYSESERKCSITLLNYDGSVIDTLECKYDTKLTMPSTPIRDSDDDDYYYVFDCWLLNGTTFNLDTKIKEDITLKATYNKVLATTKTKGFGANYTSWTELGELATGNKIIKNNFVFYNEKGRLDTKNNQTVYNSQGSQIDVNLVGKTNKLFIKGFTGSANVGYIVIKKGNELIYNTEELGVSGAEFNIELENLSAGTYSILSPTTLEQTKGNAAKYYYMYYISEECNYDCNITFKNYDGSILYETTVKAGEVPAYVGDTPTKPSDEAYHYVFDGWNKSLEIVYSDEEYVATYISEDNIYTVTWKNWNGDILETDTNVLYGATPTYNGTTPTRESTAEYTYTFANWDNEITTVKADVTYTATYTYVTNAYTVTWKNWNGDILETDTNVLYGAMPEYNGTTPTRESTAEYTYTFENWDKEIVSVTGNATYTATYSSSTRKYTYKFYCDLRVIKTDTINYGEEIIAPNNPTKDKTDQYTYEFIGWVDSDDNEITSFGTISNDISYYAKFDEIINKYTITWVDENDNVLETDYDVEYGKLPTYDGETPKKESSNEKLYYNKFSWDSEIELVTSDKTYKAKFEVVYYEYKVNYYDGNKLVGTDIYHYNDLIIRNDEYNNYYDNEYDYDLINWYLDTEYKNLFTFNTKIEDNLNLYGNYESNLIIPLAYKLVDNHYSIVGIGNVTTEDVLIPQKYHGLKVTCIETRAFFNCKTIKNITLSNEITSIGTDVFYECSSLENVYYNGTIENWCNIAFSNKYSTPMTYATEFYLLNDDGDVEYNNSNYSVLVDLIIPNTITIIGNYQFYRFIHILNIEIETSIKTIGLNSFENCLVKNLYYDGTIEDWCNISFENEFSNPMNFATKIYLLDNNGETEYTGNKYTLLTDLIIPNSISIIGKYQFYGFNCLTNIEIVTNVQKISKSAFENCSSSKNVYYDGTIEDWCNISFENEYSNPMCYARNFYMLDNDGNIEYNGNKYTLLIDLIIPNTINNIGYCQFYGFNCLENISISSLTEKISGYAFAKCNQIKEIIVPNSVTSIEFGAFEYCSSMITISLPFIGNNKNNNHFGYIFGALGYGKNGEMVPQSLKNLIISKAINNISENAFYECSSLINIYYKDSLENWCNTTMENAYSTPMYYASNFYLLDNDGDVEFNDNKYTLLTDLEVPSSITTIGAYQFYGFNCLINAELGLNVERIKSYAFGNCSNILNIEINSEITVISSNAFYNCTGLENIYYDGVLEDWFIISFGNEYSTPMYYASNIYILDNNGDVEYNGNKYALLTNLIIPEDVTTIGAYQFYGFNCLTNISIGSNVEKIEEYAFGNCFNVLNIEIGANVTEIGSYAFLKCSLITKIIVPNSVVSIGIGAFSGLSLLETIGLPFIGGSKNRNNYFGYIFGALDYKNNGKMVPQGLKNLIITMPIENLDINAFYGCSSLVNIYHNEAIEDWCNIKFLNEYSTPMYYASNFYLLDQNGSVEFNDTKYTLLNDLILPSIITAIGAYQFYGFNCLINFELGLNVTEIGAYAFYNSKVLFDVYYDGTIENWCNTIMENAYSTPMFYATNFYLLNNDGDVEFGTNKYTLLTDLEVPNSITTIGAYQFYGFNCLTTILIAESVTEIGIYAFANCNLITNIIVPNSVTTIGIGAFNRLSLLEIISLPFVGETKDSNNYLGHIFGASRGYDNKDYVPSSLNTLVITSQMAEFAYYAFYEVNNLENVFYDKSIDIWCNIKMNNEYSTPMYYASNFYVLDNDGNVECNNKKYSLLTKLVIPNNIETIGKYQFYGFNCVINVIIESNVEKIEDYAFEKCSNILNVSLGNNLKSILSDVFKDCTKLEKVYYDGIIEDWCNISFKGLYSTPMYYATKFYILDNNGNTEYNGNIYKLLTDMLISNNVTSIGNYQFYSFNCLINVEIGKNVEVIGASAFNDCNALEKVYYDGITDEWCNIKFEELSSTPMYYATEFYILDSNSNFEYNGNKYELLTNMVLSDNVTSIGNYQFYGFVNLENITIGLNVETIGKYAFANCNLITEIVVPNSVTFIGTSAFTGCSSLETMSLPFVGSKNYSADDEIQYPLGYIFGTTEYDGSIATNQTYFKGKNSYGELLTNTETYYLPVSLNKVIVTNSSYLQYGAFSYCKSIITIKLNDSIDSISGSALIGCTSLQNLVLPFIGSSKTNASYLGYVFGAPSYDKNDIYVPNTLQYLEILDGLISDNSLYNCDSIITLILPSNITSIGKYAFYNCNSLVNIAIPSSITKIDNYAFYECISLNNIYFSGTIGNWRKIALAKEYSELYSDPMYYATNFYSLSENGSVDFREKKYELLSVEFVIDYNDLFEDYYSTVYIKDSIFKYWTKLENIYYDGTIEDWCTITFRSLSSNPMYNATNFYILNENGDVEYKGNKYSLLTNLVIPESVTMIKNYAFYGFNNLISLKIHENITIIGAQAFTGCYSLENIIIDDNNQYYDSRNNCNAIIETATNNLVYGSNNTVVPNTVVSIDNYAFYDMISLVSIEISSSVTSINGAFYNCTSLENVYYDGTIEDWCNISFLNLYSNPMYYASYFYLLDSDGNVEHNGNKYRLITNLVIPDSITRIGAYQFYGFNQLTNVNVSKNVDSIGYAAFGACSSLEKITLPVVNYYDNYSSPTSKAFGYLFGTEKYDGGIQVMNNNWYYIPSSLKDVEVIGISDSMYYFSYCEMIESIIIGDNITAKLSHFSCCTNLKSIEIGNGVTSIEVSAIMYCTNLTNVVIGSSVTSIGANAFSNCTSLESINFNGKVDDWNKIEIKNAWNSESSINEIICTDGVINL